MKPSRSTHLILIIAWAWFLLTLALATWWWVHGIQQINALRILLPEMGSKLDNQYRMIFWEGLVLVGLLLLGGSGLLILILRERMRSEQLNRFFATFTHELKTPLASLRLQAESLQLDLGNDKSNLMNRLLQDASRLEIHLDNALFLATSRMSGQIHLEPTGLKEVLGRVQSMFPQILIHLNQDVTVLADPRALESVIKNLVQNSRTHGKADEIRCQVASTQGQVSIRFTDNGQGFKGKHDQLGKLFVRHSPQSGSGIGLHLCQVLIHRMQGEFEVIHSPRGFEVLMHLKEAP